MGKNHPGVKLWLDLVDFQVYIKSINGAGKQARVVLDLDLDLDLIYGVIRNDKFNKRA